MSIKIPTVDNNIYYDNDIEDDGDDGDDGDDLEEGFKAYSTMTTDDYNISQYTDEQLYDVLGFSSSPTDRELEIKILSLINQYDSDDKLSKFFNDIYDHFFEEAKTNDNPIYSTTYQTLANNPNISTDKRIGLSGEIIQGLSGEAITSYTYGDTSVLTTNNEEYVKGKLNPVKRETYFKTVLIDSRFRENKSNTQSTSYTLNLSEPISNMVSMRLYSINIPLTWHTVRSSFGSNFFYIKGNSPGINNGNHDIRIEIPSGNYDTTSLPTRINKQIQDISSQYPDTLFNNTAISYDLNSTYMTLNTNILKHYDETSYDLEVQPSSLRDFLGITNTQLSSYVIKSNPKANLIPSSIDSTATNYTLDNSNNYFNIVQTVNNNTINTYKISLTLPIGISYTRNQIYNNLVSVLATNQYLNNTKSTITRDDISGNYTLTLALSRQTTQTFINNSKYRIDFNENQAYTSFSIWTGANSVFAFYDIQGVFYLNNIYGDIPLTSQRIQVNAGTYFTLSCITSPYDVSQNSFTIQVPPNTIGYTINEFIDIVNQTSIASGIQNPESFDGINDATRTIGNPTGVFNISVDKTIRNTKISYENSKVNLTLDINKPFTQNQYTIDFSGSDLFTNYFGFSSEPYNIPTNGIINQTNPIDYASGLSYIPGIIVIRPNTNTILYGNQLQDPIVLNLGGYLSGVYTPRAVENAIQSIANQSFPQGVSLSGTNFQTNYNPTTGKFYPTFTVILNVSLIETDYRIDFSNNPLNNNTISDNGFFSWTKTFAFDQSYIIQNITTGGSSTTISSNNNLNLVADIVLNNATIKLIPWQDGVSDTTGTNDITFTLDGTYAFNELTDEINSQFMNNPITNGSIISTATDGTDFFTLFNLNINKNYTAKDYKVVWFDLTSYTSCRTKTGIGLTTSRYDTTLGWLLGFHGYTYYDLGYINSAGDTSYPNNAPIVDSTTGSISIRSDTAVNLNIYNNFLIIVDDFIQNHVNDGLITLSSVEKDIEQSNNISRMLRGCDPVTGLPILLNYTNPKAYNSMSNKSAYATNIIDYERTVRAKSMVSNERQGPNVKDVFAMVPLKPGAPGSLFVEYGGTLQNQDRKYFGPVRVQKLSIKLMNDNGETVDLNNNDWSFGVICEIIADPTKTNNVK